MVDLVDTLRRVGWLRVESCAGLGSMATIGLWDGVS